MSEGLGKIFCAMTDVTIRLGTVEELFLAPTDGAFRRSHPRLQSGIDEVLSELGRTRLGKVGMITIALPAAEIHQGSQEQVRAWIQSYCTLRLRETMSNAEHANDTNRVPAGTASGASMAGTV